MFNASGYGRLRTGSKQSVASAFNRLQGGKHRPRYWEAGRCRAETLGEQPAQICCTHRGTTRVPEGVASLAPMEMHTERGDSKLFERFRELGVTPRTPPNSRRSAK